MFEFHSSRVRTILYEEENTKDYLSNEIEKGKENEIDFLIVMEKETSILDGDHSLGVNTKMKNYGYLEEEIIKYYLNEWCLTMPRMRNIAQRRRTLVEELMVATKVTIKEIIWNSSHFGINECFFNILCCE